MVLDSVRLRVLPLTAAALLWSWPASAHGFGQRFDLPLPLWLWVAGAGASIVVSFVIVGLFVRGSPAEGSYPRLILLELPAKWPGLASIIIAVMRLVAAAVFVLTIAAGLFGTQDPYRNIAPTVVWVVWWVGVAFASVLLGDLWAIINPLRTLFAGFMAVVRTATGVRELPRHAYPTWLGVWPAVLLLLAFAWTELVWDGRDVPRQLACAILLYAAVTWVCMSLFGQDKWLRKGEAFAVLFGVLAKLAPLGKQERHLVLRAPGLGLLDPMPASASLIVFVLLMLSTVTFDGFLETPLWNDLFGAIYTDPVLTRIFYRLSEAGLDDAKILRTAGLIGFLLAFVALYWLTIWIMVRLMWAVGSKSALGIVDCATAFVMTLVPIAVAYHLAHYLSLLLTAGQFVIPLASDPFGAGWNLFGTAGYKVDIGIVGPRVIWYSAVTAIVAGHAGAVYLAHVVAMRIFHNRRDALLSQIPMVALMVGYTMISLWILAQPITD